MKRLFTITTVMILSTAMFFVVVCEGRGLFGILGESIRAGVNQETYQPITKSMKGTWSGIGYNVGQGNCPTGYLQNYAIGKGVMNLTGKSEWFSEGCLDLKTLNSTGYGVITASNGDLLFLTFDITLTPDSPDTGTWLQDVVITGGTGRFENVTGLGSSGGPYKFVGAIDVWSGTNEGEITFY